MKKIIKYFVLLCCFLFPVAGLFAQPVFTDPGIPDNETISYKVKSGTATYTETQTVRHTASGSARNYEIVSSSKASDQKMRISRATMEVIYSWIKQKETEYELETETTVNRNNLKQNNNEAVILNFQGLDHILRGFPFSRNQTVKIKTAGAGGITLNIVPKGQKDIATGIGTIRCYELELGMDGFFGGFLPKTLLWYSVAAPHYLVKYEGPSGGPGSPAMIIEIVSYKGN